MNLIEIREESGLQELRPEWDALLACSQGNVFRSWEWASAWWSTYGKPGDLRILTARDEGGALRGIAPLRAQSLQRFGQTLSALAFLGDGSNDSDYLDLILASGYEQQVMEIFGRRWSENLKAGTVLELNEIPANSPNLVLLKEMAQRNGDLWIEQDVPCGAVSLPETWDEYLGRLRPRFRTKVRSALRQLEGSPEVYFGFCDNREQIDRLLPILFDLHTRRWAKEGKPGVFGWDRKRDFYRNVSPALLDQGWLGLSWLEWNGRVLACQYGCLYGGTYFQLQEGYEPAAEHLNLGIGLRAWSIRELIRRGVRNYDFLGGVKRNKIDWGSEIKSSLKILMARNSWQNRLFVYGPEWQAKGRELVRRLVPEKILAARHARFERMHAGQCSADDLSDGADRRPWARDAAASLYYYSPLPAAVKAVRNRYGISLASSGARRRISWSRRTEACGRILCYHRVNDDHDPFFPAISTDLFDRQMRYIARHYKILSLSDMLAHLGSGSTEMALAVTFDDGYQDNYHNALPVLHRYNLPATIFLTTGAVDSGELLWFEKLALALKITAREYVDLEIDFPQRLPLQTEAERLNANTRILALLRTLPDADRRQRLEEILRQLAARGTGERWNKMLTWDQIRVMKAAGIDFGGHTETHPFNSKLTRDQVFSEASGCKKRVEEQLQLPVDFFAYPNGREEDFGMWNKEVIRAAGYRAAVTTIWGMNYRSTDPMELRRGGPWEPSAPLFAYKLDWYQLTND